MVPATVPSLSVSVPSTSQTAVRAPTLRLTNRPVPVQRTTYGPSCTARIPG
jgi:hypothetical protein